MKNKQIRKKKIRHLVSVPFIYFQIFPMALLDISISVYHSICFRLYRIPLIKRRDYIKIDRHKLKYLTWPDKINCAYCGYANGLVSYAREIAGQTEIYWCGIKHQKRKNFHEPAHHKDFMEYGDEEAYKKLLK